jgi:dihydropyrimidinase
VLLLFLAPGTLFPFAFARNKATRCNGIILVAPSQQTSLSLSKQLSISMPAIINQSATGAAVPLLIKGGQIVNDDSIFVADVLIVDGQIKQVAPTVAAPSGARVIDATGKMLMPGGIDPHTNFQLIFDGITSVDDFFIGTKAALAGGTTTIVDCVLPNATETLSSAFDRYRAMADSKVACNYALTVTIPTWNERIRDEMSQLCKEKGVNSFVMHMAYKQQKLMLRDDALYQAFDHCRQIGAVARVHAENGDIIAELEQHMLSLGITGPEGHLQARPEELESEATSRACMMGQLSNCPVYIETVMSAGCAQAVAKSRQKGCIVFGEVTAAAVGTDGTHYFNKCWRHAAAHLTSPPLRPDSATSSILIDMLAAGQLYATASAHRVFSTDQRAIGSADFTKIPHGVNGVEERMAVVWEKAVHAGKIDPMRFVAITSTNAAKLLNLYPKKGRIAVGADADIVIWDPSAKQKTSARSQVSTGDLNVFEGMTCHGSATITICAGRIVYENGQVSATAGSGKYIALNANSPYIFSVIQQRERVCQPQKIERTDAPPLPKAGATAGKAPPSQQPAGFYTRPPTSSGARNQFDSSFTVGGAQIDDAKGTRAQTKISQPPGGKSSALW